MKILVILPGSLPFPPVLGGATEKLVKYYIDANEDTKENEYTIVSGHGRNFPRITTTYKHSKCIYVNQSRIKSYLGTLFRFIVRHFLKIRIPNYYLSQAIKLVKNEKYDKIISENVVECAHFMRKTHKETPIILHLHNDSINNKNVSYAKSYDKIICVSNYLKHRLLSIDKSLQATVIYNCINLDEYNKQYETSIIKTRYGISKTKKIIMYVGRIKEEKGVSNLINGFKRSNQDNRMQLVLVGSTFFNTHKNDSFIKKIQKDIENDENIIATGYIDNSTIPSIMACADIGIIPSKCNEAFGLTLIEFMASGIPTIATNDGALPEIAKKDSTIIVSKDNNEYEIQNAINTLIYHTSKKELNHIKKKSKEIAQKYNIDEYVNKINSCVNAKK